MQIILSGLHDDASAATVTEGLARFFHVTEVTMIREGVGDNPWALVCVNDSYERVWEVCNQLRGVFHRGKKLHFYIPLHQTDVYHDLESPHHINIA